MYSNMAVFFCAVFKFLVFVKKIFSCSLDWTCIITCLRCVCEVCLYVYMHTYTSALHLLKYLDTKTAWSLFLFTVKRVSHFSFLSVGGHHGSTSLQQAILFLCSHFVSFRKNSTFSHINSVPVLLIFGKYLIVFYSCKRSIFSSVYIGA